MKRLSKKGWLKIGALSLFLISTTYLLYMFFKICFSLFQLTLLGTIVTILAMFVFVEAGTYLYEEMQ